MIYRLYTTFFLMMATLFSRQQSEALKPHECYAKMVKSYKMKSYSDVCSFANLILQSEGKETYEGDVQYYLGIAYFELNELESANEHLSLFLEKWASTKFFKSAIATKYKIARKYQNGFRKHIMGYRSLPKLESGYDEALVLFDEVIGLVPRDELAAKAMFHKAEMKIEDARFNDSVQIYETLISHFPQTDLASQSFLMIAKVRMMQCSKKSLSQNYLELSKRNILAFEAYSATDKRLQEAKAILVRMQNLFARDLFNSAQYFEKRGNFRGALLFYQSILQKYPESRYAAEIGHKVEELKKAYKLDLGVKKEA